MRWWWLFALVACGLLGLVACPRPTDCPEGLHPFKNGCADRLTINFMTCTEGRGISLEENKKARLEGRVTEGEGVLDVAREVVETENTPVSRDIVRYCLELTNRTLDIPPPQSIEITRYVDELENRSRGVADTPAAPAETPSQAPSPTAALPTHTPTLPTETPEPTATPTQEITPTMTSPVPPPLNSTFFVVMPYYDPEGQEICHRRDTEQLYSCSPPGGQPPPTSSWVCYDTNLKQYPCDPSKTDVSPLVPPPTRSDLFIVSPYYDAEGQYTCYRRDSGQPYPCNIPGDTPPPYRTDLFSVQPYYDAEGQETCYRKDSGQPYPCTMPMPGDTHPPNYDPASSWVCTDPVTEKPYPCDPFYGITKH
jgi:hypothetical protein